jgi:cysteinyl-tRNA synthetase
MAQVWVHGGLVMVNGEKMSKSLGNFQALTGLLDRYEPAAIRFLFLQTGYRKPTNFTEDSIEAATRGLRSLHADLEALDRGQQDGPAPPDALLQRSLASEFEAYLEDDLNTAGAIGWLQKKLKDARASGQSAAGYGSALRRFLDVLGLPPKAEAPAGGRQIKLSAEARARLSSIVADGSGDDRALVERVIAARAGARAAKDFARSDDIREALASAGISVKDTKAGTDWIIDVA